MGTELSRDLSTIRGLIRGILEDVRTLLREEFALARVELREQAGHARAAAMSFAIAAVSLAAGLLFLLVAAAMATADALGWPVWGGFLAVAGLLVVIGLITIASGRRQLRTVNALPEQTVSTLKENSAWIAKRLSSAQK
jgi:hypothetical protein